MASGPPAAPEEPLESFVADTGKPKVGFLDLPPEVRNHVYLHFFAMITSTLPDPYKNDGSGKMARGRMIFPGFMRTASLVRSEATEHYCKRLTRMDFHLTDVCLALCVHAAGRDGMERTREKRARAERQRRRVQKLLRML